MAQVPSSVWGVLLFASKTSTTPPSLFPLVRWAVRGREWRQGASKALPTGEIRHRHAAKSGISSCRDVVVLDPALIASILQLDAGAVLRDGDLLGRVLESFVVAQIRAELAVCASRSRLYHLREEHGRHEVDLLAELGAGKVVAFEVKAGAADLRAARHEARVHDHEPALAVADFAADVGGEERVGQRPGAPPVGPDHNRGAGELVQGTVGCLHRPSRAATASEVTGRWGYEQFSERLRVQGFAEDVESRVICRWRHARFDLMLDAMPTDPAILGFSNRWLARASPVSKQSNLARRRRKASLHRIGDWWSRVCHRSSVSSIRLMRS